MAAAGILALAGCSTAGGPALRPAPTVTVTRQAAPVKLVRPVEPVPNTVPATTPAGSPAARTEPVIFTAGTYSGTEPVEIDFSADAGNVAYGLTWRNWPGGPNGWPGPNATAVATGTVNIQGCVPACYDGTETPTPVTVILYDPIDGDPVTWGRITETITGYPVSNYAYPQPWPNGAT